ncbi:MAG: COG4280 domain-containing protein [Nocardioidaceae bacterium]
MGPGALFIAVFLACAVEAVEAATIVLAMGTTRDWRSAGLGVLGGIGVLAVTVAALGPALTLIPLGSLRLVVGGLLLVFGLQWLRKAILRASGYKALHDEDAIFHEQVAAARTATTEQRVGVPDWYAFTLSFKGVVLEGLEVAFIVLTFGTNQHDVPLASLAALAAVAVVAVAAFAVRAPLARVPENTLKLVVGVMLTSFGIFWGAEGAGAEWPGSDAALIVLVVAVALFAFVLIAVLRRRRAAEDETARPLASAGTP